VVARALIPTVPPKNREAHPPPFGWASLLVSPVAARETAAPPDTKQQLRGYKLRFVGQGWGLLRWRYDNSEEHAECFT
jgi:hypothetical protein